jgi:hypothetical protein
MSFDPSLEVRRGSMQIEFNSQMANACTPCSLTGVQELDLNQSRIRKITGFGPMVQLRVRRALLSLSLSLSLSL